jgi:membrane fusion protein, multidrug efflux system
MLSELHTDMKRTLRMIEIQSNKLTGKGTVLKLNTKTYSLRKIIFLPASIILMALVMGCGASKKEEPDTSPGTETVARVVPIEIGVAERKNLSVVKTVSGTLEGEEQANIVPKISERIMAMKVHVGEVVQTGQVAIVLDKGGASSQYYQAEANFKNAEKTLQRMKSLYEEGALSLQALDGTQTQFDIAKANFDAARSSVELTTPISGVVTAVNVSLGDLSSPGVVLVTVAKINKMKVIFNLNESDAVNLGLGQKVKVYSESRPDTRAEGQLSQLSKSADVQSRSFEIKALFPNTSDTWFKPGMFCKVDVQISGRTNSLLIPNSAIQSDGAADRVFVIRGGKAFPQIVQLGITDGTNTEIIKGLSERDTVGTVGINNLKEGSPVNIFNRSNKP